MQGLTIDHTTDDHPITVTLKDSSGVNWGATRTVRANYVVGCDGAHSSVTYCPQMDMRSCRRIFLKYFCKKFLNAKFLNANSYSSYLFGYQEI
ncbi:MAG: FAD-dependent monooxygenase [Burkholderiales bacterium]|nr:FAD-dependent monooxygenase [Burkholderiales bacterium]